MTRPIFIAMAAIAALAAAPSFAASPLTWEQEARRYVNYAFGNPSAVDAIVTGSTVESFGDYIPYVNGIGDPSGLTVSTPVDAVQTGSIVESFGDYLPYVNGVSDPSGLTSPKHLDDIQTGSVIESSGDYIPYLNGFGDPSGLTSPQYPDATETGSIGGAEPRVDVEGFCEGEGKLLAERHYVGFCHLAD